jgi:hypothetical protein
VACNIFSVIPHCVNVEGSYSLVRDVIGWTQSETTGETLCENVIVRQCARADNGILAGAVPSSNTTNTEDDSEVKKEVEESNLRRPAKVYNIFEIW